jgi:DNA-binding response OmpR family regulator
MTRTALIVEDDPDIVELLRIHLADLDCEVEATANGKTGLQLGLENPYDLIILDVMLPGMDGTEVCRRLRGKDIHTPILMLTARSEEFDKVIGLELGADDYITKPFSIREFIARAKAILRRVDRHRQQTIGGGGTVYDYGEIIIDLDKRRVTVRGDRVELSPKEFDLLTLLASEPGKCYDRGKILNLVWGYDFDGYEHTVNSHINRLRTKIEPDAQHPRYILTNWGVGYRFNEELT